jgi:ethanolamine ammonia-lyase small subunit
VARVTPHSGDVWAQLRQWTPARVGLGRAGASLPTEPMLAFELAHARARDAVHAPLDADALAMELCRERFGDSIVVCSRARDRMEYLVRPDLGRSLDAESCEMLQMALPSPLVVVIADGLSAMAPARHAVPLLVELRRQSESWENVVIVVANLARVALGDEIGEMLHAGAVVVLIGERPGLSSPDSLGIYLTWAPRVGSTDADRNCISNVRPEGLSYAEAAARLRYLLCEARRLRLSGVALKDDSDSAPRILP